MKTAFEPCFYLDLGMFRTADEDEQRAVPHVTEDCTGKTLLMVSPKGFEIFQVPAVLH